MRKEHLSGAQNGVRQGKKGMIGVVKKGHFRTQQLLPYQQALTMEDSTSGLWYDFFSHMLWVGECTGKLDGTQLEFLRGFSNPFDLKVPTFQCPYIFLFVYLWKT